MENRRLCLGDRTRSIVAGKDDAGSDQKIIRAAQMRSSGLVAVVIWRTHSFAARIEVCICQTRPAIKGLHPDRSRRPKR
jgi:hypothetical protein